MAPALALIVSRAIKGVIKSAEVAIATKGTGATKKAIAVKSLRAFIEGAIGAGEEGLAGDTPVPSDDLLASHVEMAVQQMKKAGELQVAGVDEEKALYIVRGPVSRVTLG